MTRTIRTPDGRVVTVQLPDNATDQQIEEFLNGSDFASLGGARTTVADEARQRLADRGVDPNVPVDAEANRGGTGTGNAFLDAITKTYADAHVKPVKRVLSNVGNMVKAPFAAIGEAAGAVGSAMEGNLAPAGEYLAAATFPGTRAAAGQVMTTYDQVAKGKFSDMLGDIATGTLVGAAAPQVASAAKAPLKRAAANSSIRNFNKLIGATAKDASIIGSGNPGRGVAAIQPKALTGEGRLAEIGGGLDEAINAKRALLETDPRAQQPLFDPEPLIAEAIDKKARIANASSEFSGRVAEFGQKMRDAVNEIRGAERRPLTAAEMDALRDSIDANWQSANKQYQVVAETDTRINDVAVDMDRAIRRTLESEASPIASEYKVVNRRIQDLLQAKTIQGRTNTESLFPPKARMASDTLWGDVKRVVTAPVRPVAAAVGTPIRNAFANAMGRVGGLAEPLPQPQTVPTIIPPEGGPPPQSSIAQDMTPRPTWADVLLQRNRATQQAITELSKHVRPEHAGLPIGDLLRIPSYQQMFQQIMREMAAQP